MHGCPSILNIWQKLAKTFVKTTCNKIHNIFIEQTDLSVIFVQSIKHKICSQVSLHKWEYIYIYIILYIYIFIYLFIYKTKHKYGA